MRFSIYYSVRAETKLQCGKKSQVLCIRCFKRKIVFKYYCSGQKKYMGQVPPVSPVSLPRLSDYVNLSHATSISYKIQEIPADKLNLEKLKLQTKRQRIVYRVGHRGRRMCSCDPCQQSWSAWVRCWPSSVCLFVCLSAA